MKTVSCVALIAAVPALAMAADAPPPPEGVWTGKGQLGYVTSQGNTEAESANAVIDTSLLSGAWKHSFHLGGLYGKSKGIVSAERWDSMWESDYNFSPDLFSFGNLRYSHDMFSGFQYQEAVAAGLGYKFIHTNATQLSLQFGVGYRKSREETLTPNTDDNVIGHYWRPLGDTHNDVIFTTGIDYAQQLTTSTSLSNKLLIESGSSNVLVTDVFGLNVKVSDRLALGVGVSYQYNSKPPKTVAPALPLKKVDTTETVNLVFSF